jgi:3-methyladenine DNA glycosylase AlkD
MHEIEHTLMQQANPEKALILQRFFKTKPGEYGEGDVFIGISVPIQRKIAKQYYKQIDAKSLLVLLQSPIHEYRLTALFILVLQYTHAQTDDEKETLIGIYLSNTQYVNNWDLVDSSAYNLLGKHLYTQSRSILYQLAHSTDLWEQRIAIITTYYFIRQRDFEDTLHIARILLHHPHDLIHKAVGWMIREIGNRDYETAYAFLVEHYAQMPRTMLRYAIERFDEPVRLAFLKGEI